MGNLVQRLKKTINKTAYIVITSNCNSRCNYCFYYQDSFRRKKENTIKILKILKNKGFNEITLTGGEPFLKKNLIFSIIKEAQRYNFKINLNTNGSLLDEKTLNRLRKIKNVTLYLSIKNNIDASLLKKINQKITTCLIFVITKKNLRYLEKIIKISQRLSCILILQPAYIRKEYRYYDQLSLFELDNESKKHFETLVEQWGKRNNKIKYAKLILEIYNYRKENVPKLCHMGKKDIVIDSDGSVFPCFHRQEFCAGNILIDSFDEILRSIKKSSKKTRFAQCYGEHCVSLFY